MSGEGAPLSKAKRIYIADDEANIRLAIRKFLESAGYAVEDFESGDALLAAFAESPSDLVILDVMMPGSNGFVACKELRRASHVPIIMLTARDSDLDYATGLDLGCDDYLIKPFSPMALVMRVKAIFRRMELDRLVYAERDLATGFFDKVSGINAMEKRLAESGGNAPHALFMIDIDGLGKINDGFGRAFGDKVIVHVSGILSGVFGGADIVCRFAGDEFAVLAEEAGAQAECAGGAERKARTIRDALRRGFADGECAAGVSASVGIARYPEHGLLCGDLLLAASRALGEAKKRGGNGYAICAGTQGGKLNEGESEEDKNPR